ncbi:MAG TPA: hypothetical protein DCS90_16810 [Ktedonobacter sp.]|jgi:branched-subunit amino acid aminotransferase/4-amino-4-deoxychorismate lyase|nr:hypothetical protein [Ktedonobacter sp.]
MITNLLMPFPHVHAGIGAFLVQALKDETSYQVLLASDGFTALRIRAHYSRLLSSCSIIYCPIWMAWNAPTPMQLLKSARPPAKYCSSLDERVTRPATPYESGDRFRT